MGTLFGRLLRSHREKIGVSGYRICQATGMPSGLLTALEKGRRGPSPANLELLASFAELRLSLPRLQAWADADQIGQEGLARIREHAPELLGLQVIDGAKQQESDAPPSYDVTPRERKILERMGVFDDPGNELHPESGSYVWALEPADRWRILRQAARDMGIDLKRDKNTNLELMRE